MSFRSGILLLSLAAAVSGCGRRVTLVPVAGRVTLDGKPLAGGSVMARPAAGPAARGPIDGDGRFVLGTYAAGDGAIPGPARIRVSWYERQTSGEEAMVGRSLVPQKYADFDTSGLTATIAAGMGELVLDLKSP